MLSMIIGGVLLCSATGVGLILLRGSKDAKSAEAKDEDTIPLGGISIEELMSETHTLDVEVQRGGK